MELLMITAVRSFEEDIKKLLKRHDVKSYSYVNASGYHDPSEAVQDNNWFASGAAEQDSILFYAFVAEDKIENVLVAIRELNRSQETHSHVHAVVLDIKKTS